MEIVVINEFRVDMIFQFINQINQNYFQNGTYYFHAKNDLDPEPIKKEFFHQNANQDHLNVDLGLNYSMVEGYAYISSYQHSSKKVNHEVQCHHWDAIIDLAGKAVDVDGVYLD